jgi:hypothetical protein
MTLIHELAFSTDEAGTAGPSPLYGAWLLQNQLFLGAESPHINPLG